MLVKFRSKNSAEFVLFGDVALQLIKLMGHGGTLPGAIAAEDVPAALTKLQHALAATPPAPSVSAVEETDGGEQRVSLQSRAVPLLEMLSHAVAAKSYVMWDQ